MMEYLAGGCSTNSLAGREREREILRIFRLPYIQIGLSGGNLAYHIYNDTVEFRHYADFIITAIIIAITVVNPVLGIILAIGYLLLEGIIHNIIDPKSYGEMPFEGIDLNPPSLEIDKLRIESTRF